MKKKGKEKRDRKGIYMPATENKIMKRTKAQQSRSMRRKDQET